MLSDNSEHSLPRSLSKIDFKKLEFSLFASGLILLSYSAFISLIPFVAIDSSYVSLVYLLYLVFLVLASCAPIYSFWNLIPQTGWINLAAILIVLLEAGKIFALYFAELKIEQELLVAFFLCFSLTLFAFLKFKFINYVQTRLDYFDDQAISYPGVGSSLYAAELCEGSVISPSKNQLIARDSEISSGSGIFDLMEEPLHYGVSYREEGHFIPAGSILMAGKPELRVLSPNRSAGLSIFKGFFHHDFEREIKSGKALGLFFSFVLIIVAIYLSFFNPGASADIFSQLSTIIIVMAFGLLLSIYILISYLYAVVLERLSRKGVYTSSLRDLKNRAKLSPDINRSEDLFAVNKFEVYNDALSLEKTALIIFYLASFGEEVVWRVVRQFLEENHVDSYLQNPLQKIEVKEEGFSASLEGAEVLFGTENFLLKNAVILNASDVISRSSDTAGFYLSINKDVIAAIEVSRADLADPTLYSSLLAYGKEIQTESSVKESDMKIINTGRLNIVAKTEAAPEKEQINPAVNLVFNVRTENLANLQAPFLVYNNASASSLSLPFSLIQKVGTLSLLYALFLIVISVALYFLSNDFFYALQLVIFAGIAALVMIGKVCREI